MAAVAMMTRTIVMLEELGTVAAAGTLLQLDK